MKIKVAVVGAGYWGKNLVRNFYELGALHAICDANQLTETGCRHKYPDIQLTNSYGNILSDNSIDAVVLATPAATHFQLAQQALRADKHVFVEKPLALSVDEGAGLVALAGKKSKVLMVGHVLQYHNAVLRLKELIDNGELGKIQYLYSTRLNIGKIRAEENILWSFAPHDISIILMLLGEMPESVYATGGSYLQRQVADVTLTTMDFPSGVKAHIFVSWLHPFKEQKLVAVGEKKMAVFDDTGEEKLLLYPHKIEWVKRIPVASKAKPEILPIKMIEPLKAECKHFIDCIQNGGMPKTDGYEGLRVLKVLNACQTSLNQNGAKITLDDSNMIGSCHRQIRGGEQPYRPTTSNKANFFVHESAYIDEDTEIGEGASIWHFSHVLKGCRVGANCKIGQNVVIGPNVTIGSGCKIQNNVSVYEGVTLEDNVFCGPSMVFTNVLNPRAEIPRMAELMPTLVRKGAAIGANATIICGHTIGACSFVGAGAVVTRDVPDYAIVTGNPGKITGWMCRCGVKLDFKGSKASCRACGTIYEKNRNQVKISQRKGLRKGK